MTDLKRLAQTAQARVSLLVGLSLVAAAGLMVTKAQLSSWLLCCSVALIIATILLRGGLQKIGLSLTSVAIALCLLEYIGVLMQPSIVIDIQDGLVSPRLAVGWGPERAGTYKAREVLNHRVVYDVHYTIDRDLFRQVDTARDGRATSFLGDSFIFGVGVEDADTLPQRFADLEGRALPVFNFGVGAYSPAQVLAMMQLGLVDTDFAQSELLVQFVAPWHAERTACRRSWTVEAPKYRLVDNVVRFAGVCRSPPFDILKGSAFYRSFVEPHLGVADDHDITLLVAIVKQTIELARDKYHKPMIIYYKRDPGFLRRLRWSDDAIIAALRSAGGDVLDYAISGEREPKYRLPDNHPTGLANAVHAKVLAAYLQRAYPKLSATHALSRQTATSQP